MRKTTLTILIFATLFVSACASTPAVTEAAAPTIVQEVVAPPPAATQEPAQTESAELNANYENAVSVAMQLLLGTIKLEGTQLAVTTEQASTLTPLWTNFRSLSESMRPKKGEPGQRQGQPNATQQPIDSGLQTQLDEIVKQIQSAMTAEQINAIAAMQITQEMSRTIMEEKGIAAGPLDQGGGGGGQQPDTNQMGAQPTDRMQAGGMGFIPSELIDALIQLLGQKVG